MSEERCSVCGATGRYCKSYPCIEPISPRKQDETGRFQDYDRSAERRYESWLESVKDHGP